MNQKNLFQPNWRNTLSALAIGLGAIICIDYPAKATPIQNELQLAQVGVRSGVTSPIPLNLRPRVHIPSPQSNYSNYPRHNYSRYNSGDRQDCHHHHHYKHTHYNRRRSRGRVIIISPGNHSNIGNYSNDNFIRVIRR